MQAHWDGYVKALGGQKPPHHTIDQGTKPFPTTEGNTVSTGFVEWKAKNPTQQARYDAMSGSWEGIKASEAAAASSIYKPEYVSVEKK
jgi:hypothetical protein